jgi:hypothetical protein
MSAAEQIQAQQELPKGIRQPRHVSPNLGTSLRSLDIVLNSASSIASRPSNKQAIEKYRAARERSGPLRPPQGRYRRPTGGRNNFGKHFAIAAYKTRL